MTTGGESEEEKGVYCLSSLGKSQTRMVPSRLPLARGWPSGDRASDEMPWRWPGSSLRSLPVSQNCSTLKVLPTANTIGVINDVRVTFDEAMDVTTFTIDQFQITGPGGVALPVTAVTAVPYTNNTQFDITFALTAGPGAYMLQVGPNLKDVYGNVMDAPFTSTFTVVS
jgi:hypothetical protein